MEYPKGTWTKEQWIEVVSKSEILDGFDFKSEDLEDYGRTYRDYKTLKSCIDQAHSNIISADIATLSGPYYPEGAKWLTKRQAQNLLDQVDSLIFNAKLVKDQLENV